MNKKLHLIFCIIFVSLFFSCATFRANMFLIQNTTDSEKAELLFEEGLRRYNHSLVENSYFKDISNIHQIFSDVLVLDPGHSEAGMYIEIINNFKIDHFSKSIKTANKLIVKVNRTKREDFQLVLSVCHAQDLNMKDESLPLLIKETKELKHSIIDKNLVVLEDLESRILNESNYTNQIKLLRQAEKAINELNQIDPTNRYTKTLIGKITQSINQKTNDDLEILRDQIDSKKYIDAELNLRNIESRHNILSKKEISQIRSIKYDLFYNWGNELFADGKLVLARNITILAINNDKTREAKTLLSNINEEIKKINFEDSIRDVLESIDHYLSKEKPLMAQKIVNNNINKFELKKNKIALKKKEELIKDQIFQFYKIGTEMYYEEDYASAIEKLSVVMAYNNNFENVEDFLHKAKQKNNALSGK